MHREVHLTRLESLAHEVMHQIEEHDPSHADELMSQTLTETPDDSGTLRARCHAMIEIDLEITSLNLRSLQRDLTEARERLEFRLRHRDAIIALHAAELTGREDLFEW